MKICKLSVLYIFLIAALSAPSIAYSKKIDIYLPEDFRAFDMPGDAGGAIAIIWRTAPYDSKDTRYAVFVSYDNKKEIKIAEFPSDSHYMRDLKYPWWTWNNSKENYHFYLAESKGAIKIEDYKEYRFRIEVSNSRVSKSTDIIPAHSEGNLFNYALINNVIIVLSFAGVLFYSIEHAKRKGGLFLRKIPGLDAVEEAIGRATEMGKPILYLTGSDSIDSISTIAASVILGEVAKKTAAYNTKLTVPHRDPVVMAVCQEIVKESYLEAGRPDAYSDDFNFYITSDQFSYTAAVNGIMMREKPAANFYMGTYFAESLLLAETGASTGAIQIAGTDSDHQLPFFITACDYTLIGEELYAASAYLSKEPVLLGTLRGQDISKAIFLFVLIAGSILATLGMIFDLEYIRYFLDIFKDFK